VTSQFGMFGNCSDPFPIGLFSKHVITPLVLRMRRFCSHKIRLTSFDSTEVEGTHVGVPSLPRSAEIAKLQ
jgi:hypothetical protein